MALFGDRYMWRQYAILLTDFVCSISSGFLLAFPSVLNPAILSPNSTDIKATSAQASSIAGSQGLAGAAGLVLLPFCMNSIGRKSVHIVINFVMGFGFLIFSLATNILYLYAGRIIQGVILSGVYVTSIMVAEYSDPTRRGYFITIKKGSVALGSLTCHLMGIYCTWRQCAIFAIFPNLLAIIMTLYWPESPSYLAMKGRYKECEKSHKWLFGENSEQMKNLEDIIAAQRERRSREKNKNPLRTTITKMFKKDYVIPFVVVSLLTIIIDCSGRYYMNAYIGQILTEMIDKKSVANYFALGSDTLGIIALICSCFIIKMFGRRQNLFGFGAVCVMLMYLISILTYLKSNYPQIVFGLLPPIVILVNVFIVNVGIIPTCFTIVGEIFPLEHKSSGIFTTGIVFNLFYAAVLKFTPLMIEYGGIQVTFAVFATINLICFLILYFILIETKDKTLQEIENELKGIKSPCSNEQLLMEHQKN
ncbi:facilitated trehalose transporter Tret1-like [Danaus plexippus]|uniref:facilitated trehalose transporter Tret1-like n=1 Tax=Danaus plexippus TaxID=13037 RepID=UPI002AB107D0|nr:facilitated trehalose transporter Tret1-like [Danaus plexippus]